MVNEETLICEICKRNIRELNAFPIYSEKHGILCSHCCFIGAEYSLGDLTDHQLSPIPEDIRNKIKMIYNN